MEKQPSINVSSISLSCVSFTLDSEVESELPETVTVLRFAIKSSTDNEEESDSGAGLSASNILLSMSGVTASSKTSISCATTVDTGISIDNEQENRPTRGPGVDASYSFVSENDNSSISVADPEECARSLDGCDDSELALGRVEVTKPDTTTLGESCDNDNISVNCTLIEHQRDSESDTQSCCSCEKCQCSCSCDDCRCSCSCDECQCSDTDNVSNSGHSLDADEDISNHSTAITNPTGIDHSISLSSKDDCSCKEAHSDCDRNGIDSTQQKDGDSFTHIPTRSMSFPSVNSEDHESSVGDRRSVITNSNSDSSLCSCRHCCLHRSENGSCGDCSCGSSWTSSDSDSCCSCDGCYSDTSDDETDYGYDGDDEEIID